MEQLDLVEAVELSPVEEYERMKFSPSFLISAIASSNKARSA
jgi:hypothetical protein